MIFYMYICSKINIHYNQNINTNIISQKYIPNISKIKACNAKRGVRNANTLLTENDKFGNGHRNNLPSHNIKKS